MSGRKFESHLTMDKAHAEKVQRMTAIHDTPLIYSQIDGDPVMGAKPYCYLTGYSPDGQHLLTRMQEAKQRLEAVGVPVLRVKIEEIVFDSKTGHDVLT